MADRYTISLPATSAAEYFKVKVSDDYSPRYNAAPAQLLPVITAHAPLGFSFFYWGTIPGWSGNKSISQKLLTVSVEEVISRSVVRQLLKSRRCIIPADGVYFWKKVGKKSRIPYRITLQSKSPFGIAGIWEEFEDENDQTHHTFRMISTAAPQNLHFLTDSMPVVLDKEQQDRWLNEKTSEEEAIELLKPVAGGKLSFYTVSSKIDQIALDIPELIKPVSAMDQFGNYSLFE